MAWVRKTLYLRKDLVERLRELRERGFVMSAVVEKALRSYLSNHHEKPQRVRICVVLSEETYSKIRGGKSGKTWLNWKSSSGIGTELLSCVSRIRNTEALMR